MLFNQDWKFLLGDPKNAFKEHYPDRTWKNIDLPHDWVISQPFERGGAGSWTGQNMQGFFAWEGVAWYRKEFFLENLAGREVYVYFGGAYRNSVVYVNGRQAGGRAYGYASFELDITGLVKEGKNLIAVRLDNGCEAPDRWYSGSGLYRNVYLKIVPETHIKTWGVHITSEQKGSAAVVTVTTAIVGKKGTAASKKGVICARILDSNRKVILENITPFDLAGKAEITVNQQMQVRKPELWSAESPNLYIAIVHLVVEGTEEKPVELPFGIRTISIVNHKGMMVNGQPVKLKGVCLHHDCGITGSAYYDSAWRRRLLTLKSIGCNAIRTSHNPPAEEFLDLCDELGFYVVDECFDKWKSGYYAAHFDDDSKHDLEDMILRDRNHPSVFMWSIGNEVENQGADTMLKIQKQLAAIVRGMDDRPITCALAPHVNPRSLVGAPPAELVKITQKLAQDVDVLGFNYHEPLYEYYTAAIEKPILGTECYEYYSSTASNYEDITDKNPWRFVLENDNVIGQFIWAGIDYLGESPWPAKGWAGSILDICGFMKPNAWFRKSIWSDEPVVYLAFYDQGKKPDYARGRWSFPPLSSHLNLDHLSRRTVTAMIFTNCDEAELWINGKKMGRRTPADGIIEWTFEYHPGVIKVVGYRKGEELCVHELTTAGLSHSIQLMPDRKTMSRGDIAHVEVSIIDKNGVPCPNEELLLEFALSGDGEILGACSPDLNANLGFTLPKVVSSGGKALVMIKAGDSPGTLELTAHSGELKPASLRFKVQ
jgi:beta-galactosidase